MISKRLLELVLGQELYLEHLWDLQPNGFLYYTESNGGGEHINLYELAHKCKLWSHSGGYFINSGQLDGHSGKHSKKWFASVFNPYKRLGQEITSIYGNDIVHTIYADNEPDAIIEACEFVLKIVDDEKNV